MPEQRYQEIQAKLARGGRLLAREWDWLDAYEKHKHPEAYAARQRESRRRHAMKIAARELSIEDLEQIVAEKRNA